MGLKVKAIKPMFDHIVTTMDRYDEPQMVNGIILRAKIKGGVKEYQRVISVGSFVKNVAPGDIVCINPKAYGRPVHKDAHSVKGLEDPEYQDSVNMVYRLPTIEIDGEDYLFIAERDIDYVITDYEETKDEEPVIQVASPLMTN